MTPSRSNILAAVATGFAVPALLLATLLSNSVSAQSTPVADEYSVQPGKLFMLNIDSSKPASTIRYQLLNAPPGVSLRTDSAGISAIHWIPPITVAAKTVVLVRGVDSDSGMFVGAKRIVLHRVSDQAGQAIGATTSTRVTGATTAAQTIESASSLFIPEISTQQLNAGQRYQLFITAREKLSNTAQHDSKSTDTTANSQQIIVAATALPTGATLGRAFGNTYMLQWIPLQTQAGVHVVELSAVHESASGAASGGRSVSVRKNVSATRSIVLQVSAATGNTDAITKAIPAATETASLAAGDNNTPVNTVEIPASRNDQLSGRPYYLTESSRLDPLPGALEGATTTATDNDPLDEVDDAVITAGNTDDENPPGALALKPVSSQIVSAGSYLQFRVQPLSVDGSEVTLQIDRLPKDATFDQNEDGSRTFYWQTNTEQQGEHLFRFTATTADAPNKQASMDVMIIVGDPTIATTRPR